MDSNTHTHTLCYETLSKTFPFSGPVFPKVGLDLDLEAPSCPCWPVRGNLAM